MLSPVQQDGVPRPSADREGPVPDGLPPTRILVVDDRRDSLLAIQSVLQSPDHELVLAGSGAEALRFLLNHECALLLLDVQMPEMDGYETARLVRGNPRTRSIPIIFMSAVHREPRFVAMGYDAGAIDYLLKPVDPDVLRAKVARLGQLHRDGREALTRQIQLHARERAERQLAIEQLELRSQRRQTLASERYRRLMDGIHHAVVWSLDPDTLICTLVSASTEALLGQPPEAWMRDPTAWQRLLAPEDRERFLAAVRAARAGSAVSLDHGFVRRDGSVARFRTELRHLPADEEGQPELRGFSVDVTEAQEAEEVLTYLAHAGLELSGSLDLEDTARRAASLAVPFLADACTVTVWMGDREVRAAVPEPAAAPSGGATAAPGGEPAEDASAEHLLPMNLRFRDHDLGWMRLRRRRPFTAREKRAARELAERASHALENALLYRKAQEAVRMRDEFLSVASHELRSPLTALTLQVRLAERAISPDGPGAGTLPARVAGLARQVDRLNRLVANLLDVTRARVGRMDLTLEPVELVALVEEVSGHFEEELARQSRQARVTSDGPVEGCWDRVKLEQVLTNLLSNAVRYGASGPVEISVVRQGEVAEVTVRDHGPGIRPEEQARIFDRYERGRAAEGTGGLGLGLFLVRLLVEMHGGCVRLESAPGRGTAFTVALPLRPPASVDAEAPAANPAAEE
jgi:PAS domain S-box-containing protein